MKSFNPIVCILVFVFLSPLCLSDEGDGGYAGSFLDLGVGARAIAMGKTFSAIADDGTALFWNPAGLIQTENKEISVMHALIFEDRAENYFAFVYPNSKYTLGLGWMHFGVGDIQERDNSGELIGHFSDSENLFMLSTGISAFSTSSFDVGLGTTIKYFYHSLHDYHAKGWAADFGALVSLNQNDFIQRLGFALVLQNLGGKLKWNTPSDHEDDIPSSIRFGSAVKLRTYPVEIALDLEKQNNRSMRIHLGSEYVLWEILYLRAGLNHDQLTAGAGYLFTINKLEFQASYAFTDDDISNKGLHFFSLILRF